MKERKLDVQIIGCAGTGKSTVARVMASLFPCRMLTI
jgi:cytidylate kinase